METTSATITVIDLRPVNAGKLLALADVELSIEGVVMVIHGIQVRADAARTEITLPTYRASDGSWRAAITLPEELRGTMGDIVISAGIEAGILKQREPA